MADRLHASTQRKKYDRQVQLKQQQQNRARRLVALVPKSGANSDINESESSADELEYPVWRKTNSDSSSPPPSLPSSLENLNLLSDLSDDDNINQVVESTSLLTYQPLSTVNSSSPSLLSQDETRYACPLSPGQSTSRQVNFIQSPLATLSAVLSPRIDTKNSTRSTVNNVPQPRVSNLTCYDQVPSPLNVPSPSVTTRSQRPVVIATQRKVLPPKKLEPNWRCTKFTGTAEVEPNNFFEISHEGKSAIEYFKLFFSDDIISAVTEQTNLYSTQVKGTSINITHNDINDFLAIILLMGITKMPAYTDYWSKALRYDKIAGIMPLKKFQQIRRYLHFNDNLKDDGDRYYKVRPLLEKIRQNCLKVEEENRFSIDEMMVPHKGTRAGSRKQYIKNKPKKWGFKIFVRAGVSGIVYDFLVYGGDDTFRFNSFNDVENSMGLGSKVVLALAKSIRVPACKILCFDNFFTSIELLQYLRFEYGIFSLGTIRQNRIRGAEKKLPTDKNLKKKGRGSHAQVVCNKNKIAVCKWYDNKCVTVASTYIDAHPLQEVVRYKKEERKKVPVTCPNLVREYNTNMGGVDLADMLIALYRTPLRGHRWYLPICSQMLDICVNNAWLLYRRDLKGRKGKTLKIFKLEIIESLLRFERLALSTASPSTSGFTQKIVKPVAERPPDIIRYDQIAHFPTVVPNRGRCMYCTKGQTKISCQKCKLRLCLSQDRNCFLDYHKIK